MVVRNNFAQRVSKSDAGRMGAHARMARYGNPGTAEGRSKGGTQSIETHKSRKTGFKMLKHISIPCSSAELAEFMGIMMGDGHVDEFQTSMTTNSETDFEHAKHVQSLIHELFGINATLSKKKNQNACTVVASSKSLCEYLQSQGLPKGSKIRFGVRVPSWITDNPTYTAACVRGLFDTDGCVFLDRHTIKGKLYFSLGIALASNSPELLKLFTDGLTNLGLHPTQTTPRRVFLRRSSEIERYFAVVGTSNPKHLKRYAEFRRHIHGGVG